MKWGELSMMLRSILLSDSDIVFVHCISAVFLLQCQRHLCSVLIMMHCCVHYCGRAVCRKHELTQFELEMASQDLISKKQQREELSTGVHCAH